MSLLDTASLLLTPNAYKEGKLYSVIPSDGSGDLSVTRATTATRVNSAGLVELVPYNLVSYSEQFDNVYWIKGNTTIISNITTAPNGTNTAEKVSETSATNFHYVSFPNGIMTSTNNYTLSFYAKAAERNWCSVYLYDGTNLYQTFFDLANGVIGTIGSGMTANIDNMGNGWYRCAVSRNISGTSNANGGILTALADNQSNYTGTTGSGIYIWGAQLVEGSTALPYQKTETRLNITRLDYSNGSCPSILVEPQRTNLALYSEQFDNASWTKVGGSTISANTIVAPNGTLTADTLTIPSPSVKTYIVQNITSTAQCSASIYVKKITGSTATKVRISFNNQVAWNSGKSIVVDLTDDWQRVEIPECLLTLATGVRFFIGNLTPNNEIDTSITGGDIAIWGAQLEAGAYATSYIPTTSASVTRNADVLSKTGISSLLNSTQGVLYFEAKALVNNTGNSVISISNGTNQNTLYLGYSGTANSLVAQLIVGGAAQCNFNHTLSSATDTHKVAVMYASNNAKFYVNGVQIDVDTTINVPSPGTFDRLLNNLGQGSFPFYSNLSSILYFNTTLTDDQLAQLTTI